MTQILYGKQVVRQVLKERGRVRKLYLLNPDREIEKLAREARVPVERADKNRMNRLCEIGNHQGMAVDVNSYET